MISQRLPSFRGAERISRCKVSAFTVPTDAPEADGTLDWHSTTMVLVELTAGGLTGLGFTYAGLSSATLIHEKLRDIVVGADPLDLTETGNRMVKEVRNLGRPGVASCAISALDIALWDLKAKQIGLPLVKMLGQTSPGVRVYGSGGFTSYSSRQLEDQLGGWAASGIADVKMKIGRDTEADVERVKVARQAVGHGVGLFVDANGAYTPRLAVAQAKRFEPFRIAWFEEPVSSDDLKGLRFVREQLQSETEIAAGEYAYDSYYFRRMLESGAVDVLQADATRCGGISGFMKAAALAEAFHTPLSAHTAPAIHLHPCCAAENARNLEYFHDHVRIEQMFFDGARRPTAGLLSPDLSRPGLGLVLKRPDAARFEIQ